MPHKTMMTSMLMRRLWRRRGMVWYRGEGTHCASASKSLAQHGLPRKQHAIAKPHRCLAGVANPVFFPLPNLASLSDAHTQSRVKVSGSFCSALRLSCCFSKLPVLGLNWPPGVETKVVLPVSQISCQSAKVVVFTQVDHNYRNSVYIISNSQFCDAKTSTCAAESTEEGAKSQLGGRSSRDAILARTDTHGAFEATCFSPLLLPRFRFSFSSWSPPSAECFHPRFQAADEFSGRRVTLAILFCRRSSYFCFSEKMASLCR